MPYANADLFRDEVLRDTLEKLIPFAGEFSPPADGDEERGERFFWHNSQFTFSDALAYYCFIRWARPATIVEIGGGFSTLVAEEAVARNGAGAIHVIDPFPRSFLRRSGVQLHIRNAQDISADFLNDLLRDGDILFIDSTHTVKTGSDCLHIYLRLLPAIRRRVLVHVHDVFLPFGVPQEWLLDKQIFWTEQYLLMAFLLDNPKASVLFGSAWHAHANRPQLERLMDGKSDAAGGSLWFEYRG
ncbi:MAG: class I SAM-dependent methyltransferase [Thermoanaerobaculia bacterium]